jgi:DNA anti-recombination protein RmuC
MTEKRFILDDDGIVTDMVDLSIYIDNEDCCEKLNELSEENKELKEENQHIKNTIKEAYNNERTQLGKSVLKQLMEAIQ